MAEFTENSFRGLADRFADTNERVEYFQRCREVLQALLEVGLLDPGIEGRFVKLRYYEAGFTKGLKASLRHDSSPDLRVSEVVELGLSGGDEALRLGETLRCVKKHSFFIGLCEMVESRTKVVDGFVNEVYNPRGIHFGSPSQRTEIAADEDQEPDKKPEEQSRAAEPLAKPLTAPEGFCVPCGSFDACYANECQWELGHKPCAHYRLDQ